MQQLIEDPLSASGDDRCGILVNPGDPRVMAHALGTVLSDPELYQNLRPNTRERVLAHFRLEQAMAAYRTTYEQTITANSRVAQPDPVTMPNRCDTTRGTPHPGYIFALSALS